MINFTLNDRPKAIDKDRLSVQEMMESSFPDHHRGMAIAVNNQVIPKNAWNNTFLSEKDNVLVITATQGG